MKNIIKDYEKDVKAFNKEMEEHVTKDVKSYWIGDFAFDLFRERNDLKEEVKKLKKKVKELEKEAIWCGDDRVR